MMEHLLEKIYYHSPVFFQSVMVSVYGTKLAKRRSGGNTRQYVKELLKTQWMGAEEISRLQEELFLEFVRHALTTVPFYISWVDKNGLNIRDIRGISDIQYLPIIQKEDVRKDPLLFVSGGSLKKRDFVLYTSGTSGKPLKIFCDYESRRRHYAFWTRFQLWQEVNPRTWSATFCGRVIVPPEQKTPPFWRYDLTGKNVLFSSYHLSEENLPHYCKKLTELEVAEIIGYPSSLFALAKFIEEEKLTVISPKVVITTAETLLPHQRAIIEKAFGCKVVDQYGCTEMVLFVSQCEHGTYHLHPEHGYLETLSADGSVANPGENGEAICTGFVNKTMPLLRYRLGDVVRLAKRNVCPCGRHFPVVEEIIGRVDDILITPDGRPLGRLDPIFKGMQGIFETQIVQSERSSLDVCVVADSKFTSENKRDLLGEFRKRTGEAMTIKIHMVDHIPKDKNGKFRAVISLINKEEGKPGQFGKEGVNVPGCIC